MILNCDFSHCISHCAITAIVLILFTFALDIILYVSYAYFKVRRYYSLDITQWRNRSLARYGYYEPGTTGGDWNEIYPPVDDNSKDAELRSIAVNDNWVWATSVNNDVYVCKKPCDGSTADAYWRLVPGKLRQISANNNAVWGVAGDDRVYTMSTKTNKGNFKVTPAKLKNVSVGSTGWVWGSDGSKMPYVCQPQGACWKKWNKMRGNQSVQMAVGQKYAWSLDAAGNISVKAINGTGAWSRVAVPAPMAFITCGLSDNLFGLTQNDGSLYKLSNKEWILVQNAPKLKTLAVNNEIYGIGKDNSIWIGILSK
jgi:hypothetical protein